MANPTTDDEPNVKELCSDIREEMEDRENGLKHWYSESYEQGSVVFTREESLGEYPEDDRAVSIQPSWDRHEDNPDVYFVLSSNEINTGEFGHRFDNFGPNLVEWSATSVSEAVKLGIRAYDAEEGASQPTIREGQ